MCSSEEFYALVNRVIKNTHLNTHSSAYGAENKLEQSLQYCPPQMAACLRSTRSGEKMQNRSDVNSPSLDNGVLARLLQKILLVVTDFSMQTPLNY